MVTVLLMSGSYGRLEATRLSPEEAAFAIERLWEEKVNRDASKPAICVPVIRLKEN